MSPSLKLLTVNTNKQSLSGMFEMLLIWGNINCKAVKLIKHCWKYVLRLNTALWNPGQSVGTPVKFKRKTFI